MLTAIKQVSVTSAAHLKSLAGYLNDERALMRNSQNLVDESRWAEEMDHTREAYGHNSPSRACNNYTYMYHHIIGFNPDECSCNGGTMTPEKCMQFAREWVQGRYPNQEAVWVLHKEHCAVDSSDRYAIHMCINRTDLESGNRLHEGLGRAAKVARANAMREMDARWGLHQLEKGQRNSRVHAMQPTRTEKEMRARGAVPDKDMMRQCVRARVREIAQEAPRGNRMRELAVRLKADGIEMTVSKNAKQVQFRREGSDRKIGGWRLGRGFSASGLAAGLGIGAVKQLGNEISQEMER